MLEDTIYLSYITSRAQSRGPLTWTGFRDVLTLLNFTLVIVKFSTLYKTTENWFKKILGSSEDTVPRHISRLPPWQSVQHSHFKLLNGYVNLTALLIKRKTYPNWDSRSTLGVYRYYPLTSPDNLIGIDYRWDWIAALLSHSTACTLYLYPARDRRCKANHVV